jgi:hypothetical protein
MSIETKNGRLMFEYYNVLISSFGAELCACLDGVCRKMVDEKVKCSLIECRHASAVASTCPEVNMAELRRRQEHPTTTHGMDGDHGAFDVPDFWRISAFSSLSDTPEQTLFTDTRFGEADVLSITWHPILISTQNCP